LPAVRGRGGACGESEDSKRGGGKREEVAAHAKQLAGPAPVSKDESTLTSRALISGLSIVREGRGSCPCLSLPPIPRPRRPCRALARAAKIPVT
jgi:hypothetical protein